MNSNKLRDGGKSIMRAPLTEKERRAMKERAAAAAQARIAAYDPKKWTTRHASTGLFKPGVKLDPSQVRDLRGGKQPPRMGTAEALVALGRLVAGKVLPHPPAGSIPPGSFTPKPRRRQQTGLAAKAAKTAQRAAPPGATAARTTARRKV